MKLRKLIIKKKRKIEDIGTGVIENEKTRNDHDQLVNQISNFSGGWLLFIRKTM